VKAKTGDWSKLRLLFDQQGQTLPWMALMLVLLIGMGGLTTDLGHAYVCYRELQASTDAAALAGAYEMASATSTSASVKAAVANFSSGAGGANVTSNLPNTQVSTTLKCLSSVTIPCTASATTNNALQVTQTVSVPTYFIRALSVFGVKAAKNLTLKATATAAMRGAPDAPWNVAIVLDTTSSMGQSDTDASCNNKRITCALSGFRTLLQSLTPCPPSGTCTPCTPTSSSCTPFDQVSLFTYPGVKASTVSNDYNCSGTNPTVLSYYTPSAPTVPVSGSTWVPPTGSYPTYQITSFLSDYSSTNQRNAPLNTSSYLTKAAGGKSGCAGMQTPGGVQTYFAGAIYAAQSSLLVAQSKNPGSLNAMVILSDGDANSSHICKTWSTTNPSTCTAYAGNNGNVYGSAQDQCQQAIAAAAAAHTQGTTVYSIAYGASSGGCSTDTSGPQAGISACSTMRQLASAPANFFSDATASQNKGQCTSASNPNLTLDSIFKQVAYSFTYPRLVPNNAR
jgi:Flp pilus assembly protein TadG